MKKTDLKMAKKCFATNIISADVKGKTLVFAAHRNNPKFYDETGLEFSPEGATLICSKTLPEGSSVQMKMLIPEDDRIHRINTDGTIRSHEKIHGATKDYFRMNVCFTSLEAADKQTLRTLWEKYCG
ncbi:MAG: PilZ domain-containing protein [Candidatus Omnitrophica bacterium]|nr:PilZ domain-containing protein [Candidatus Omnitrophota bacterium]